jgi:hypothetical protein
MGYDIDMVVTPTLPIPGYEPQIEGCPGYIRLAGMSMPYMIEIMQDAGVLDDDAQHAPFPDWPPNGLEEERAGDLLDFFEEGEAIDPPPTWRETRMMRAYLAACDEVVRTPSRRPGRVPAFKFCSNDNWFVSPQECRSIAEGLERLVEAARLRQGMQPTQAEGIDWDGVRRWATYNRIAAEHGGYRVN